MVNVENKPCGGLVFSSSYSQALHIAKAVAISRFNLTTGIFLALFSDFAVKAVCNILKSKIHFCRATRLGCNTSGHRSNRKSIFLQPDCSHSIHQFGFKRLSIYLVDDKSTYPSCTISKNIANYIYIPSVWTCKSRHSWNSVIQIIICIKVDVIVPVFRRIIYHKSIAVLSVSNKEIAVHPISYRLLINRHVTIVLFCHPEVFTLFTYR